MNVKQLREKLATYPDDMPVKVSKDDGNAWIHDDPDLNVQKYYRVGTPGHYVVVEVRVLEIS